ncbi:probable glutamate receptor [Panulirus ornatus]|uniref:probable glutamate receptor n=1 Tax=Panulirus ornatus TaxID=150431 RepID=UPI003A845B8A
MSNNEKMSSLKPFLRVAVEQWMPWIKTDVQEDGTVKVLGPMANLLDILADKVNFEYALVQPPDHAWGVSLPNGSWTGMMGMLQKEEVEIVLGPSSMSHQRETICDFSDPIVTDDFAILMIRPTLQNDVSGFLKPFAMEVWLLTLMSLMSVILAMTFLERMEGEIYNFTTKNVHSKATMWAIQNLSQESSEWLPRMNGGRLLVVTWLLASLVFMSSYSGILTAMLTLPRIPIPIDSMEDLVAQSDLPWRLEAGSMIYQYFKEATDEVRQKVFVNSDVAAKGCWAARESIASGEFAAICDRTNMKMAMSWDFSTTGSCHLYISRENVYSNAMLALAFTTKSTYLARANHVISTVKESGVFDKWVRDEITNTSQCLRPLTSTQREGISPLNIEALSGPFLLLSGGMVAGVLVFLTELVSWWVYGGDP